MCNNAGITWHISMPTNPSPVNPKVEMPLELDEEEDATVELISSTKGSCLPHSDGLVCMLQ